MQRCCRRWDRTRRSELALAAWRACGPIDPSLSALRSIITTPCGWELAQQQVLRQACINAQLIPPERSDAIRFVTEAEASINYCAMSAAGDWLDRPGSHLIVLDAGGGTIDIVSARAAVRPSLNVR